MKTVIILAALAVVAVHAHPHPEYILTQDDAGRMKLENTNQQDVAENFFDAVADTRFWLFTGRTLAEPEELLMGNEESFTNSNFNPNHPTR